ncbi:hypothetical protein MKW98_017011 [Papaver atlanticum]|uniref:Uncharacterized protein n=1 Tax=Papaver atlanticum TaxID=357466 RepID=A0AAD4TJP8_9MAGN|nr:hypothetical protein MKW98_017011 [Papaver atlanticum]
MGSFQKAGAFSLIGAHSFYILHPFQPVHRNAVPSLRPHRRTPTSAPRMDHQAADSDHLMKHMPTGPYEEVSLSSVGHPSIFNLQDDLPKVFVRA